MKKKIVSGIIAMVIIISIVSSCFGNPADPYANLEPGRRDYIWEIDTIKAVPLMLERLWGSSPDDVWAIGNNNGGYNCWHFDGEKWNREITNIGFYPSSIWGFSSDNIWAAGQDGRIWHYDGNNWSDNFRVQDSQGEIRYIFYNIWGDSPNNVYAVGCKLDSVKTSLIYHFDGEMWNKIAHNSITGSLTRIRRGIKTNNNYYLSNSIGDAYNEDTTQFYKFDGLNKLTKIYENLSWKGSVPQEINGEVFFNFEGGMYRYNDFASEFNLVVQNPYPEVINVVFGRNIKDVVWKMWDGLTHYNGENIDYILKLQKEIYPNDVFLFKEEIFFLVYEWETNSNLIYRGKLK